MKKKISRILGVVLSLALLSSLAIVSAPVSAGTQVWSTFATPAAGAAAGRVLDPGNTFTGPFAIDKDGTAIYAASDVGGGGAALVKSQDGGRTWTLLTGFMAAVAATPGTFTDIVCSSIDANTVYVTDGVTIWKTSDGGTTWAPLSSLFTSLGLTPGLGEAGFIASLDVGYLGTHPYIFAACSSFGTGAGGAYVCEEAVWGMPWSALLLDTDRTVAWEGADVYDVVVDPTNFATTQMVMAAAVSTGPYGEYPLVASNNGNATWVAAPALSGSSAELTIPTTYVMGDEAKVQMPLSASGLTLNGINSISYQYYVDPSTPATAGVYEGFIKIETLAVEPSGFGYAGYNTFGAPYLVIELDADLDGAADTWVVQAKWAASSTGSWLTDNIEATEPFHVPSLGTITPGFSIGGNWGNLTEIKAAVSSLAPSATLGDARVLAVKVAIGNWNPLGPTPPNGPVVNYVDNITLNGVAYDPEPVKTYVTTKYGGAQWDASVNDVSLPGVASALYSASLWLPDDFNSNLASGLMQAFVGVDPFTATEGDVFLAVFAFPAGPATVAFDLNVSSIAVATHVSGLDGVGSAAGASLLASGSTQTALTTPRVFRSTTGGFTWVPDTKRPTGGATPFGINRALPSILVLDSSTALVGTHGLDCGVSITKDYGATWNTISLVNTTITSIDDLELGSFFMTTSGANDAVWRHDGTNWERVFSGSIFVGATTNFLVEASPAGDVVFVADLGGTNIWRSTDNGQTWMLQVNNITSTGPLNGTISSIAVIDANTLVVGDATNANTVYTTTTNGGFWFTRACAVGTVQTLVRDAGTGDLLAGGTTNIRRSQNGGISWSAVGTPLTLAITSTSLAFSTEYATNDTIFATGVDSTTDAGVWSYDFGAATPAWTRIDGTNPYDATTGGDPEDVNAGVGLVAAPAITGVAGAEMVYAADGGASQGVSRIRQPRTVAEQMADAASTFMGLWYEPGSNKLYTVDMAAPRIRTYTDTLNVSGTGVAVSAITTTTAAVSWSDLPNAATYLVVVNTTARTNFYTAANSAGVAVAVNNTANTATVTGLLSGVTYNVSVWAAAPVSSYLFDAAATSFTTLPTPPTAPVGLVPANGAINIPILGPAFAWSPPAVPGITGYNFELTTDPTFATITVGTANPAEPYLVWAGPLEYETAYYWRVRAVTAAGVSVWVTSVFTTVAEPEPPVTIEPPPTPTIILPTPTVTVIPPDIDVTVEPPDITVDIPTPTTTIVEPVIEMPEEVTPAYIWVIVAIGALLVILVITLIIRTRRVV